MQNPSCGWFALILRPLHVCVCVVWGVLGVDHEAMEELISASVGQCYYAVLMVAHLAV